MSENEIVLRSAKILVKALDRMSDKTLPSEIANIVKFHSKGAGVAGLAAGWAPGVGSTLAVTAAAGFVWTMYGRINAKLGVPIGKNILKSVASAVCTNLAAYMAGILVGSAVASLLPGIGNVAAAGINGATVFALTWVSGLMYLKLLTLLAKRNVELSSVSAEEMKATMKEVVAGENIKSLLKDAKDMFKRQKDSGELDDINQDECIIDDEVDVEVEVEKSSNHPKFCSECGAKLNSGKFCSECGTNVQEGCML